MLQSKTSDKALSLFMGLSGLYYIFSSIGIFYKRLNAYARIKIAISLWTLTLLTTFFKTYISNVSLKALSTHLEILNNYIPSSNAQIFSHTSGPSILINPLLLCFLILNMIIYIIIPLWYINLSEVKKYFK